MAGEAADSQIERENQNPSVSGLRARVEVGAREEQGKGQASAVAGEGERLAAVHPYFRSAGRPQDVSGARPVVPHAAETEDRQSDAVGVRVADQQAEEWATCQNYDAFAEAVTRPFAEDAVRLVRCVPGCDVLDVAAGTGSFALAAARRGARVLATDFAPAMLHQLEAKTHAEGLATVRTAVMDGQALDVEDNSFDVAGSLFGLMFFPNYDLGLRELHRVLRPGGQAVIGVWAAPARVELMRLLGEAAMAAMIDVPLSAGQPLWAPLSDAAHLPERLRRLGFARAHVVVVRHMWAFEQAEYLAELLPTMTPAYAELLRLMSAEQRELFCKALADGLRERQGDGPFALTTEGLIAVGTKAR